MRGFTTAPCNSNLFTFRKPVRANTTKHKGFSYDVLRHHGILPHQSPIFSAWWARRLEPRAAVLWVNSPPLEEIDWNVFVFNATVLTFLGIADFMAHLTKWRVWHKGPLVIFKAYSCWTVTDGEWFYSNQIVYLPCCFHSFLCPFVSLFFHFNGLKWLSL